jgi:hypothetical protein
MHRTRSNCHPERSEGSCRRASRLGEKIPRSARDDMSLLGLTDHLTAPRFFKIPTTSPTGIASTVFPFARSVVALKSEL